MKKIEEILTQCIDDIKSGKSSLEDCLNNYPEKRDELEPLLRIALNIKQPADIIPSDAFKTRAKVNLMEHIHTSQSKKKAPRLLPRVSIGQLWTAGWARAVAIVIAVILCISVAGTGVAYASQSSLPGDTLYSVKLGTEQIQRIFTFDNTAEVNLELRFAVNRLEEIEKIANKRIDKITIAIDGYERNLDLATIKAEKINDNAESVETVALAILNHLSRLDEIEDGVPGTAQQTIINVREVVIDYHIRVLGKLAMVNPVRATEINLEAIQGRLDRAQFQAGRGNGKGVEDALGEFERLRRFGDEISGSAMRMGYDTKMIDELNTQATNGYMNTLNSIYGKVSQEIKGAVETSMDVVQEEHEQAMKRLQGSGNQR